MVEQSIEGGSDKTVINIPCEESLKARNNPASIVLNMPVDDPSTGQELPMLPLQVVGTTNVRFTSPIQTGVPVPQIHAPPQRSVAVDKKPAAVRKVRSTWTTQEDETLLTILKTKINCEISQCKWPEVATLLGTGRNGKQCRDRWINYLRPGIKKGGWMEEEERLLVDMYEAFGPKWTAMAGILKNRTDNDIKNKWNSMQRKEQRIINSIRSNATDSASSTRSSTIQGTPFANNTSQEYNFDAVPPHASYENMMRSPIATYSAEV